MKETSPRNIAASVHARLKNFSRPTGRSFNELLQYYGMERFIARLVQSDFVENFIGRRDTTFSDTTPDALTEKFWGREVNVIQWRAFLRKNRFEEHDLEDSCREIRRFFEEVQGALVQDHAFPFTWPPEGGRGEWNSRNRNILCRK